MHTEELGIPLAQLAKRSLTLERFPWDWLDLNLVVEYKESINPTVYDAGISLGFGLNK